MLYTPERYPVESVLHQAEFLPRKRGKRTRGYVDLVTAFDIETTRLTVEGHDQSIMYVWQWAFENDVVIGRTWDQWKVFVERLNRVLNETDSHLVSYIHNAGYEMSFIKGVWDFGPDDIFCVDQRKPLRFDCDMVEFRCSYLHSGLSLRAWLNEVKAPHRKLSGARFACGLTLNFDVIYSFT